ncbi:hypothetical protein PR202_gb23320 [Eleusine coracana subsp. coracana]|uniref:Protein kinase domain-containing protein n=1 Tax=Eleusine coracana subsp. coracana TaxID=191504 RepID=A0AAV5FI99_ELECO|nr:hypothetical protein PR202_gb23320 [Eleusine coracana subsp. coracana]
MLLIISAAALITAVALTTQQVSAAAAAAPPAPIGLPSCNTTCGNISVPYPFGIQPGCFRPGFNLTCDTRQNPPRLLGDGTLRVVDIFIQNATVRVLQDGPRVYPVDKITSDDGLNITLATVFAGGHYRMPVFKNELVLFGCDMLATLVAGKTRDATNINGSGSEAVGCTSFCSGSGGEGKYCSHSGCCQASFSSIDAGGYMPTEVHLRMLQSRKVTILEANSYVTVFLAEEGWLDNWGAENEESDTPEPKNDIPLIVRWDIVQGLALPDSGGDEEGCPRGVATLCRSNHSDCTDDSEGDEIYLCRCEQGYSGNPYVAGGCQEFYQCQLTPTRPRSTTLIASAGRGLSMRKAALEAGEQWFPKLAWRKYERGNLMDHVVVPSRDDHIMLAIDDDVQRWKLEGAGSGENVQGSVLVRAAVAEGKAIDWLCGEEINECDDPQSNGCFGECINRVGSFECRCPSGTFGNPTVRRGCVKTNSTTATDPDMAPAQIGLQECNINCGVVRVPYPFGFGPSRCYLPGLGLTCDASHNPPRLLLGGNDSTLQVVDISLNDSTVRVIQTSTFDVTESTNQVVFDSGGPASTVDEQVGVHFPDIAAPYMLSTGNEFVLSGCNVEATLLGEYRNSTNSIISSCVSTCTSGIIIVDSDVAPIIPRRNGGQYCSGKDGCCHAHIPAGSRPKKVEFKWLPNRNSSQESPLPPLAFVAEEGQIDQWYMIFNMSTADYFADTDTTTNMSTIRRNMASQVPLVLRWVVKQEVRTSVQSDCMHQGESYTCHCKKGFYGNPYIIDGCQDIDECKIPMIRNACFGYCKNLPGSYECRCPRGTHGNPYRLNGCVETITGLTIGLLVAIGPTLMFLVLGATLAIRKFKQHRIKLLKQKHFDQNRGQLLQQLVSQRADIAERMIIPVDELAKATNNFDKARELGGGGHGTVYKGILSDQHVVAIKKSKITVQREINEFINEVAILSQVNHRNVVKLLGCCLETEVPLLVYEFISNGTLYDHLHVEGPVSLSWTNRMRIAKETAHALAYLHSSVSVPIIHRDIKSSNILLDDALTAKVSDFGASRYIPVEKTGLTTAVQGTIGYLDPMCFYTGRHNEKSDVYSFGVILIELLTRKKPFSYLSSDGDGLVMHFVNLHTDDNLSKILDPHVKEEGDKEVEEVATLAVSCIKMSSDRPTMRQVDHTLQGLLTSMKYTEDNNMMAEQRIPSRRYSMEQEFVMSGSYPR